MSNERHHVSEMNKAEAEKNRLRVLAYFREHPFASQAECAIALGLNRVTISRHVSVLRERMAQDVKA